MDKDQYLKNQGVPSRYIKKTDARAYSQPFHPIVDQLKSGEKSGLFLYGDVGTGKTQFVVDLISKLSEENKIDATNVEFKDGRVVQVVNQIYDRRFFKFISAPRLMVDIRSLFSKNQALSEYLDDLKRYKYLVIDDLGVEKSTDWVIETLYIIINDRYEENLGTIITSNKDLHEISISLGDRVASRLAELCIILELTGRDKRIKD